MKVMIFAIVLNKISKGLTMQINFHSILWSYFPRVPIFLSITVCVCVCVCAQSWPKISASLKKNIYIYIYTHTHTHVGFYGLRGLSIGVMVFILYKLYVLLPYTYPTPKLSPHRRRCISTFPPKNALCMIYKHFKLWGHWKCPHKSPSPCKTYVIPMSLYKFVSS